MPLLGDFQDAPKRSIMSAQGGSGPRDVADTWKRQSWELAETGEEARQALVMGGDMWSQR